MPTVGQQFTRKTLIVMTASTAYVQPSLEPSLLLELILQPLLLRELLLEPHRRLRPPRLGLREAPLLPAEPGRGQPAPPC